MTGERRVEWDAWAAERLAEGWHPRAVAVACGVSVRTAYRWRKAIGTVTVSVGGWSATFLARVDGPPVRVSDWTREDEP